MISRWTGTALEPLDSCDPTLSVEAADSWLVSDGTALALEAHRQRFAASVPPALEIDAFWDASLAQIPSEGAWFPRVELHTGSQLIFRLREAPDRRRSAVLATWGGDDPRRSPTVKGPDLERLSRVRTSVQPTGADEAVLLTDDGYVVEGAYSGLLWWRGEILCGPPAAFPRVDSVTARTVLTLAPVLGHDVHEETVTPAELDGVELWVLSALHGIRIATSWVDGPSLAQQPGRLGTWRGRFEALRKPALPKAVVSPRGTSRQPQ